MQFKPSDDADRREVAPQEWTEMARARPDEYMEQADQWAVLPHEVEDMDKREKGSRFGWEQRDTGDDALAPQSSFTALEQAQHHVDIVVAGVGGGGMNAVNRMISTRVRGVRFI